jgi:protein-S-isoprenylcysteine O-methyltransferase Ste14
MVNAKIIGKILYAGVFLIILPVLLFYWSTSLKIAIPVPNIPLGVSLIIGFFGIFLMLKAMLDIYFLGRGLPMNAFPPKKFVTNGIYSVFSHPIYLGAVSLSLSTSLFFKSSSGLYVVTPVFALACLALVLGYEDIQLNRLFGKDKEKHNPLFSFPDNSEKVTSLIKRLVIDIRVFFPWFLAYGIISFANNSSFPKLSMVFLAIYALVFVAALSSRTQSQLRHFAVAGTIASFASAYVYIFNPSLNFSVVWAFVAASCMASRILPRFKWALYLIPVLLFIFTGSLANASIELIIGLIATNYSVIWQWLQRCTNWLANSRHDWHFGNFRIINHSIPSGIAAFVGAAIVSIFLGTNLLVLLLTTFALVGAGLFAQLFRGTSKLLRPFSFWGALVGGILAALILPAIFHISFFKIAVAFALAAPFMQAIGRIRCLIQGCCHGAVANEKIGIRVFNEQSRVCVISGLKGKWIHNTQLYSILSNLAIGPFMLYLWSKQVQLPIITGTYLTLMGITRFVEEGYRGEAQTKIVLGMRVYQWFAVLSVLAGIFVSTINSSAQLQISGSINLTSLGTALICGLLAAFMMSMDFPKSNTRFSRLSG